MFKISSSPILARAKKLLGFSDSNQIKVEVSENSLALHQQTLEQLAVLNQSMMMIDHERFSGSEFMEYFKIKISFEQRGSEQQRLQQAAEILQVGLSSQNSFLKISQIEGQFFSSKQQDLYQFILEQIYVEQDLASFKVACQNELNRILSLLSTPAGKVAMQSYMEEINKIASHATGLKLFANFKACELTDFSTLQTVADIFSTISKQNLLEFTEIHALVVKKFDVFEKLGPVIGITKEQNNPEAYSKILQFIGLQDKYNDTFIKFKDLLVVLQEWEKSFQSLTAIRQSFDPDRYQIPLEFVSDVPGINVYQRYHSWLPKK